MDSVLFSINLFGAPCQVLVWHALLAAYLLGWLPCAVGFTRGMFSASVAREVDAEDEENAAIGCIAATFWPFVLSCVIAVKSMRTLARLIARLARRR